MGFVDRNSKQASTVMPYEIDAGFSAPAVEDIHAAAQQVRELTGILLRPKRPAEPSSLTFVPAQVSCSTHVGGDEIRCDVGNFSTGSVIHEVCHVLGMIHEHQRPDRTGLVEVNLQNLNDPGEAHNFEVDLDGDIMTVYDFDSIMHYPENAFAKSNTKTITTKDRQPIGQRSRMSRLDVQAVALTYGTRWLPEYPDDSVGFGPGVALRDQFSDMRELRCPRGKVVIGFKLFKHHNVVCPRILCANPDGSDAVWNPEREDDSVGFAPGVALIDQFSDTRVLHCPEDKFVIGFKFFKHHNQLCPRILCAKLDGTEEEWIPGAEDDSVGFGPGVALRDQFSDTREIRCDPGHEVRGFKLFKHHNQMCPAILSK